MDPVTVGLGTAGAAGGLIGPLLNYFGKGEERQYNLDVFREANAFTKQQNDYSRLSNEQTAQKQMDFQKEMSSTAYQRATQDMRQAGINPMLAFSQGGASTPSGAGFASPSGGSASPPMMESGLGALGEGFSKIGPSAMAVASTLKELESKDAGIAATKAGALASVAMANRSNADAKAIQAGMPSIEGRSRTAGIEAEAREAQARSGKSQAEIDRAWQKYDAIEKRVLNVIGGASDALGILKGGQAIRNSGRDQIMREERHLKDQGRLGTELK